MNIYTNTQNLNFGQLVPTKELLKTALRMQNYDDSKLLYTSVTDKFPGNAGFYKQAIKITDNILEKNPEIQNIVNKLKSCSKHTLSQEINKTIKALGENVDVVI